MNTGKGKIKKFVTQIEGTNLKNPDGSSRERLLNNLNQFEELILEYDNDRAVEDSVVKIMRLDGKQIGFLPKEVEQDILKKRLLNYKFKGIYLKLTKKSKREETKILLVESSPEISEEELSNYMRDLDLEKLEQEEGVKSHYNLKLEMLIDNLNSRLVKKRDSIKKEGFDSEGNRIAYDLEFEKAIEEFEEKLKELNKKLPEFAHKKVNPFAALPKPLLPSKKYVPQIQRIKKDAIEHKKKNKEKVIFLSPENEQEKIQKRLIIWMFIILVFILFYYLLGVFMK